MIGHGLLQITINHGYIPQIFMAEFLFTSTLRRREQFSLRLIGGFIVYGAVSVMLPNLIARYTSGIFSLTIFLLSLLLWMFCLEASFRDILFCCVGAQLTQNLSYNMENLIYQPFSRYFNMAGWFCLSVAVTVMVYTLCYILFVRRLRASDGICIDGRYVYILSIASALFIYTMQFLFQSYHIDTLWITRPPLILCCIAGLCVQFGLLALNNEREDRLLLERVLEKEQRQYEITRNSMDLINMKAHDLKHQISLMRSAGKCDTAELSEIESAIDQYENSSNTGCKPLDVILTEKHLRCRESNIQLNVMAQGEALSFLRPAEIAALFGNILDNAIEYEQTVEPPARRCIALHVSVRGGFVCIRAENYCPTKPEMREGLPISSKADHNYHGFGLRSVRYLVEKHGGTLHVGVEGSLFVVSLLLPQPDIQ